MVGPEEEVRRGHCVTSHVLGVALAEGEHIFWHHDVFLQAADVYRLVSLLVEDASTAASHLRLETFAAAMTASESS